MSFEILPNMPDFMKCVPVRLYQIGKYKAVLVKNPPLVSDRIPDKKIPATVKYLYAMVVLHEDALQMIVTSELTSGFLLDFMPEDLKDKMKESSGKPFLCAFFADGVHVNFGKDGDWSDVNMFCNKCFDIISDKLKISTSPILLSHSSNCTNDESNSPLTFRNRIQKWHFGKILLIVSIDLILLALIPEIGNDFGDIEFGSSYIEVYTFIVVFVVIISIVVVWIWLSAKDKN